MKILQLDVDNITYELVKPEARVHEEGGEKRVSVDDAIAILVSVEKGDDASTAKEAMKDVSAFMAKQGRKRLVIYPFAHLSRNLLAPEEAQKVLNDMLADAPEGAEVRKAPFGWNKKLSLAVKGHPLAEMSRSYGGAPGAEPVAHAKAKPVISTAIVRKSDWSGLPDTDHRTIGEKLDLYSFQEVSPGMTYWHPNGYIIYKELFKYIREMLEKYGYLEIATPAFANIALWHVSGHDEHYKDNMFLFEVDGQQYGLKPMNCPSTFMVFKSKKWSYREFPVRFADFDKLYRNEISGALTGLFRVRELTQDDAHLFVREDQIESELAMVIRMIEELYKKFKLIKRDTENFTLWNERGTLEDFISAEAIVTRFTEWRLTKYEERRQLLIKDVTEQIRWMSEKLRFILFYLAHVDQFKNKKKEDLIALLLKNDFADYDRLLQMQMWSLTRERIEELKNEISEQKKYLASLKGDTAVEMYRRELKEFKYP